MSLKKDIVIVNEYTVKLAKGGSRGGTPGDYVLRYMARDGATEDVTPVRYDTENFVLRYMARAQAVDNAQSVSGLKDDMRHIQGDGGIAFGYGDVSLSHRKLKEAAKDIQNNFDAGKTVLKTVLSFDEQYLKSRGVIDPSFELEHPGDYRGRIDQMKLRMAIMNGLDKFSKDYDDLQYIGVIQVDTKHVHCHLAMVDRGRGTIMPDGTQRGKITDKGKETIRRGIDNFLDEKQSVKMMVSNVDHDKRNTVCFVKKYTHRLIEERGFAQFLIACLPEDRRLWRAGTNRQEMRKANHIVREYVEELLQQPDSGYAEALDHVERYARARSRKEGLSGKTYRELRANGQKRIIEEGMNCVYSVLKSIPDEDMRTRTPMMEVMAMPYEEMASHTEEDPMIEFGFKLRSYKSRLDHHKKERRKYHDAVEDYKKREEEGQTDEASRPLFEYLQIEEEYNEMLMAKYQHFLKFVPPTDEYQEEFDAYMAYDRRVHNTRRMTKDPVMQGMNADNAEEYGQQVYGESGGQYVITDQELLERRLHDMMMHRDAMRRDLEYHISEYGMTLDDQDNVHVDPKYDFDDVKALDIHHLMYDFPYDFDISVVNIDRFVDMADRRYDAFQKAKQYLINSGQGEMLDSFPEDDINLQHSVAERLNTDHVFRSERKETESQRRATRTIRIDYDRYYDHEDELKAYIKQSIQDLDFEQ